MPLPDPMVWASLRSAIPGLIAGLALLQPAAAQPWAPGQEPPPAPAATPAQARDLEILRRTGTGVDLRRRYLEAAHTLLQGYWAPREQPRLLLAGDSAQGCGVREVREPMAYYCPMSNEIALAVNLRRSVRSARGRSDRDLLLLDFAVLAHEWGHHVNREKGRGPYSGASGFTVRQEELAADWRTGVVFGWLLGNAVIGVDDFTQTANLLFELGDYERITPQHHGYPRDRFEAFTRGLASQVAVGQRLGEWTLDSREAFSRPVPSAAVSDLDPARRVYAVRRFEIDRSTQIATNVLGGLLGAVSCLWGSQQQCLGMALEQGKGRAEGTYTNRTLTLDCAAGLFDVSDDDYGPQPWSRDGKGQAAVLASRDCRR